MSTGPFRVADVRAHFPLLQRKIDGDRIVYLDSANTSQKPQQVIDAMSRFMEHSYGPINRSAYQLASEATDAYEGARTKVRHFINARRDHEVVFTKNATESINLLAHAFASATAKSSHGRWDGDARFVLSPGDNIVVTLLGVRGNQYKVGIEAPRDVVVHREEVYEAIEREDDDSGA